MLTGIVIAKLALVAVVIATLAYTALVIWKRKRELNHK